MKKFYSQISSGKFKGKKLLLPSSQTTRSTKNIVKGSFFDTFRYELVGKNFIEAFGGSALMAAEALSNEAQTAYAIEIDKNAFKIAFENAKIIGENLNVFNADTFDLTPQLIKKSTKPVILYLDPPFDIRDGFNDIYQKCYEMIKTIDKDKIFLIAIEHISGLDLPNSIGNFTLIKTKKFGNTSLSYYK
ncbi:MAG: 16S rRNA (guanine(966)-N(2))-methyltransferase RsmD [Campylobacter sp.]